MRLSVSYMGTKRQLAGHVAALVDRSRGGPFLDVFSGMCSVASAIGRHRSVWTNDLQHFAHSVGKAYFGSPSLSRSKLNILELMHAQTLPSKRALDEAYAEDIRQEEAWLDAGDWKSLRAQQDEFQHRVENDAPGIMTPRYGAAYFSVTQAVEIDAIRQAIEHNAAQGLLTLDDQRWLVLGLAQAAAKCTTSTGHFAQPLAPKPKNLPKYVAQRRRSIWSEFAAGLDALVPYGSAAWRRSNQSFREEATGLLIKLQNAQMRPAVVYADPPYTNDQYSRYYHLYETLLLFDTPAVTGRGRYRDDRAVSPFSLKSGVANAMENLIKSTRETGADIIISYPENGLLAGSGEIIPDLLRRHYGGEVEVHRLAHIHSTLGASKGPVKTEVTEILYRATA